MQQTNSDLRPFRVDLRSLLAGSQIDERDARIPRLRLDALVGRPSPSPFRRWVEAKAATLYALLGEPVRKEFSSLVKRRSGKDLLRFLVDRPSSEWEQLARVLKGRPSGGVTAPVLFTHDVDYQDCYDAVAWLARLEHDHGIRGCYNFLVDAGYRTDRGLLKELISMGHEVGLHGHTYDLRLAYRPTREIRRRLGFARGKLEECLGSRVRGFRNHSLLLSPALLQAVDDLGFDYDSGVYARNLSDGFSQFFCWPFRYEARALCELPVLWPQDTELFRSLELSDGEAARFMESRIALVVEAGGVACINHHPSIMASHREYLARLIDFAGARKLQSLTPSALVDAVFEWPGPGRESHVPR